MGETSDWLDWFHWFDWFYWFYWLDWLILRQSPETRGESPVRLVLLVQLVELVGAWLVLRCLVRGAGEKKTGDRRPGTGDVDGGVRL